MFQENVSETILQHISDVIYMQDNNGNIVYCNHPEKLQHLIEENSQIYREEDHYYQKKEMEMKTGGEKYRLHHYKEITDVYQKIQDLGTDEVTNLPVRSIVQAQLQDIVQDCAIGLIDIDYFKNINDTFDHNYGDQILAELASILKNSIRKEDFVGRYGGEEFLVILKNKNFYSSLKRFEQMRQKIEKHFDHPDFDSITVSIGISTYKEGDSAFARLNEADHALYYVKENGRNNLAYFNGQTFQLVNNNQAERKK